MMIGKMQLQELYEAVGGDYQNVLERLGDEETIETFVIGFLEDPSYAQLLQYLQENDLTCAFRAAHTLKGVSQTLGFGRLGDCAGKLCEELREKNLPSESILQLLEKEFRCVNVAINAYKNCK